MKDHQIVLQHVKKYQILWKFLTYMVVLQPDSNMCHKIWRWKQETELFERTGHGKSKQEIYEFVEPFLPLTYVCYEKLKPDVKIKINRFHTFYKMIE